MLHEGLVAELVSSTNTATYLAGDPDRVYPLVIPQKKPRGAAQTPCTVYETRNVERQVTYCATSGLVRSTIQLDHYSPDYNEVKRLAEAVRQALQDFRGMLGGLVDVRAASLETEFDLQDFEPGLYRVSQSWAFWHVE